MLEYKFEYSFLIGLCRGFGLKGIAKIASVLLEVKRSGEAALIDEISK